MHIKGAKNTKCRLRYEREIPKSASDYYTNPEPRLKESQEDGVGEPNQEDSDEEPGQPHDEMAVEDGLNLGNADDESICEPMDDDPPAAEKPSNTAIREQFMAYSEQAKKDYAELQDEFKAGIALMKILNDAGAPLILYEKLFNWHIDYLSAKKKVSEKELMNRLRKRYNMEDTRPYEVKCELPISGVSVKVPCFDAGAMFRDLLTEPQIKEEDYLFFGDDPTAPPPEEWLELRDINSGLAYRETYNQLIRPNPRTKSGRFKVLIPVLGYQDATVTGSMSALSIEFLKFTFGIFNSKAREKNFTWRTLGAFPEYETRLSKAARAIHTSSHTSAKSYFTDTESEEDDDSRPFVPDFAVGAYIDSSDDEDDMFNPQIPTGHDNQTMQDFHKILHVILGSYRRVQESGGVEWDLKWKQLWLLQFIPFWVAQKGDTVEHDKMCAKYGSRTAKVAQLCRYCLVPTAQTAEAYVTYPRKTQTMITELVRKKNAIALKGMSQKFIWNAWYEIRFGLHNDYGIHGACPLEILHWILLGMYKYSRQMFFDQTGDDTILSREISTICSSLGWLFQRQSDKRYPRTKFREGIRSGYLQGHHFSGVILLLATAIRTTRGQNALKNLARGAQLNFFPDEQWIQDWLLLLETQLEFEQWLKKPTMSVNTVIRLRTKVREFMELTKTVGKRSKGMGFNTMNFHGILHVPNDILCFGPPHTVNTMSNESHHKPDKKSARRTQRRPKNFTIQVARKIEDRRVIDMAVEELCGRPRWEYYSGFVHPKQKEPPESGNVTPKLGGVRAKFEYSEEDDKWVYTLTRSIQSINKYQYSQLMVDAISDVAMQVNEYQEHLMVHSELTVGGCIYRASPYFQGKQWHDWAMFRFRDDEDGDNEDDPSGFLHNDTQKNPAIMPAQICCFIDLTELPAENSTKFTPTIYMICETVTRNTADSEQIRSELFQPYIKTTQQNAATNTEFTRMQVLSLENMVGPACVIPDLDNTNPRAYIRVLPMTEWANQFELWVNDPHTREFDEPQLRSGDP